MTEYIIRVRVDDPDGVGKDALRKGMQNLIEDYVNGHSPFYFTIDQIDNAIPKSVDDIILKGICPHCKKQELIEEERGEDYICIGCDNCGRMIHIETDEMGYSSVVMTWFDETKPEFEDEMEEIIYDRNDR